MGVNTDSLHSCGTAHTITTQLCLLSYTQIAVIHWLMLLWLRIKVCLLAIVSVNQVCFAASYHQWKVKASLSRSISAGLGRVQHPGTPWGWTVLHTPASVHSPSQPEGDWDVLGECCIVGETGEPNCRHPETRRQGHGWTRQLLQEGGKWDIGQGKLG